jgi:hypothetical protein
MTSLEQFLNKTNTSTKISMEPALGSFACQHEECDETINDGYVDKENNRLHWTCIHGHESSVII